MEYNTEKNVEKIKMLAGFIREDAMEILEGLSLSADNDKLNYLWRLCEMIGECAEQAKVLIGKMSDEREDMEGA